MPNPVRKTLLLVEDDFIIALNEKMQLESYGYSVLLAETGEKAIEAARAFSDIDLILMDINLGKGMDGTEAAEAILEERIIPIVFLSSHMEPDIVERTEKITSYGYVVKSSCATVLDASIKMAFRLFEAHQELLTKNRLIHERSQLLENIFNTFPGVVFWKDLKFVYQGCNTTFASNAGLSSPGEIAGKTDFDLPWKDHEATDYRCDDIATVDTHEPKLHITETQHRCDGATRHYDTSKLPLYDDNGRINGLLGVSIDITKHIELEESLRQSQSRIETLLEMANLFEWQFDVRKEQIAGSKAWIESLGYRPDEFPLTVPEAKGLLHPDDLYPLEHAIQAHIEGKSEAFDITYRVKSKDGAYLSFQDIGKVFAWDERGAPLKLCGIRKKIGEAPRHA